MNEATDTSFTDLGATDIAELVRAGRTSAVDVVRAHLDRIASRDGELSAFQHVLRDEALAEAGALDRRSDRDRLPLAGVPVAVKNNIDVAGVPTRHGTAATRDLPAGKDDELVRRLRVAGCVVVGTTRLPELAGWGFTSSESFGPTRNPHDPSLDPGGSTGGGAVAVATGMAALALGTDGGGSLRIPAAYCGVVGVKPTARLLPVPGGLDEHWCGLTVPGPIARTARDAAAALTALGAATAPEPVGRMRIALSAKSPSPFGRPDDHQRAALERAADALRAAGHEVVDADPPYPPTLLNLWSRRWWAGIARDADRLGVNPADLERRTRTMVRKGKRVDRFGGPRASAAQAWWAKVAKWFGDFDVVLMPVVATTPIKAGQYDGARYLKTFLMAARSTPYTPAWNLAGNPAVAVPVGMRDGLPLAVQLAGPASSEARLLGLAAQLEETSGTAGRH